jgi:hypothetical protein
VSIMKSSTAFGEDQAFDQDVDGPQDNMENALGDVPNVPRELKNRVHSLEDQISDIYDVVAKDAALSAGAMEHVIVSRPLMSAAIAFGLGCAFGLVLRPARR